MRSSPHSNSTAFGLYEQISALGSIAAIPVFAWEMSLAVWLITKGFKPMASTSGATQRMGMDPVPA